LQIAVHALATALKVNNLPLALPDASMLATRDRLRAALRHPAQ
jgi:hypothetical protein